MTVHDQAIVNRIATAEAVGMPSMFSSQHRILLRRRGMYRNGLKRVLDVMLVLMAAPVVVPFILGTALALLIMEGGSPFYRQDRVGRYGKIYKMWKLRSMVPDAEARLAGYLAANPVARAEWDSTQKLKADPRITRLGRLLRKSSMDEMPQLWNVLLGDMSLVGPRPMMDGQQGMYPGTSYYALRPGITGFWQVSKRNDSTFADRAGFDDRYDREVSLGTDLWLLAATVGVVVRATGH